MSEFIPGLQLSEMFYREAVKPVLGEYLPGLPHSAALIGYGSETLAEIHNGLGITTVVEPRVSTYFGRPFNAINAHRFKDALTETLSTSLLKEISCLGSVDQFVDSTHVTQNCQRMRRLTNIYGASWQSDSAQT